MNRLRLAVLATNSWLCELLDRVWPYPGIGSLWRSYERRAAALAGAADPSVVVDIGAGRETPYGAAVVDGPAQLIGVDILADDLEANAALTRRIVWDIIADGMPAEAQQVGLITSRMVLEHLPDLEMFARDTYHALAPGGRTIHLFAGRFSIFACLNRMLGEAVSGRVLGALRPELAEPGGFRAYYDRTHGPAARAVFEQAGFRDVEVLVSYEMSGYFRFCFPLFVVVRLWESALRRLGIEALGAYVLLMAQRP